MRLDSQQRSGLDVHKMSSFIVISALPLSDQTKRAWKEAGAVILRRGSTDERVLGFLRDYPFIINLGKTMFQPTEQVENIWNYGPDIEPLVWPGSTRELFGDLMPPRPTEFPADVWIKTPGRAGRGKFHKQVDHELHLPRQWDWQEHLEGEEYRIITVGRRIVQDFRRFGQNGDRSYEWLAMRDVPSVLKDLVREAASRVAQQTVVAWDTMLTTTGQPYLFEGNTCPGMSTATAERIVREIERQREESNA